MVLLSGEKRRVRSGVFTFQVLKGLYEDERVIALGCGVRSIRFRPALTVSTDELTDGLAALDRVLTAIAR